jgi:hypothetical protein
MGALAVAPMPVMRSFPSIRTIVRMVLPAGPAFRTGR